VLTQFGYHLIRVDAKQGDSLALRHILVPDRAERLEAARTDRRADSLATAGRDERGPRASSPRPARRFGLAPARASVVEGEPLTLRRAVVPSVSAWAFSGVERGRDERAVRGARGVLPGAPSTR
jgi:hypothetical protein